MRIASARGAKALSSVQGVRTRLYTLAVSNPGHAVRLMLERKGIETQVVNLLPGIHPLLLWGMGFRHGTVPAMKLDGRRIEGSLEIARELERLVPEPPLYPADPERRRAVEEAERWGEAVLQGVPRRVFRWALAHDGATRTRFAKAIGVPLPALAGALSWPSARALAARAHADEAHVRSDLANLRAMLDHVDELIADGTIGGEEPNAADFQILSTVRLIAALEDFEPAVAGRPCDALARRWLPRMPEAPPFLPTELKALAGV
jgi:glutathione S-transferase